MNHALLVSFNVVLACFVSIFCDEDYADIKDTSEIPIFDTCGTLLQEYYLNASLKTLNPEEREMFYDSYVIDRIEREDNRTLEAMKGIPTLDYDNINDTAEKTLFQTCGTLFKHYWEDYSLRNLTSKERDFYYDEETMKEIKKEEEELRQEEKDKEWLRKMEEKVINEEIDSIERSRTTDITYHDFVSPLPRTTVMVASPIDNLFCSQASNVSETDISRDTFNREMKYGDAPRWLADRFDHLHDAFIKRRDKKAIQDAVMRGLLPSTGRIVPASTRTTKKRRMLTHRYDRTKKLQQKGYDKHKSKEHSHPIWETTKMRLKRNVESDKLQNNVKVTSKSNSEEETTKKPVRKRQKITNQDGVVILKKWADEVRQGELELEREERREKKIAEKLKLKMEKAKLKEEQKKLLTKLIRSTKYTKRKTQTTTVPVITEDSWETTKMVITATRRPMYHTLLHSLGLYGHFNLAKENTQPNAEQTEVDINEVFEILSPSKQFTKKWANATTPRKKLRQSTTPYYEHTLPNRHNRTVYYWMYERMYAKYSPPTPMVDSVPAHSFEKTEEKPLEIEFMDYLFDTRKNKPTIQLNLTTVKISAREYESFLAKHQIYRKVYENHWRLATMAHWNIGDTRFQKHNVKSKWGADFYDRRPYSSTRRQDNINYLDLDMEIVGNNFTRPDFKRHKYTFADSYEYHDPFLKHLEDPGHVTANWTTIDFANQRFPIGPHQRYPNGSLKSAEVLIKEDYEFRKNVIGESCEIYNEEFAHPDELTKPSAEYIEHRIKQDRFFYPNVSLTIGPKHAEKSVYDIYGSSEYEDLYRKWIVFKHNETLNNVSLMEETREKNYVDPQHIIDIAYKYTTTYNPFKHETIQTEPGEIGIKFKFKIDRAAFDLLP